MSYPYENISISDAHARVLDRAFRCTRPIQQIAPLGTPAPPLGTGYNFPSDQFVYNQEYYYPPAKMSSRIPVGSNFAATKQCGRYRTNTDKAIINKFQNKTRPYNSSDFYGFPGSVRYETTNVPYGGSYNYAIPPRPGSVPYGGSYNYAIPPRPRSAYEIPYDFSQEPILEVPNPLHKCRPVDSRMCIQSNTPSLFKFNLASSSFDTNFMSKPILRVNMIRNFDNSVDFLVFFKNENAIYPQYPPNPAYDNFITPFDINSPIYKGSHTYRPNY